MTDIRSLLGQSLGDSIDIARRDGLTPVTGRLVDVGRDRRGRPTSIVIDARRPVEPARIPERIRHLQQPWEIVRTAVPWDTVDTITPADRRPR